MPDSNSKSLWVSQAEVRAALAHERRPGVRRRLVAVGKVLEGKSIKQAARAAKATLGSVERWLKQVRQSGLQALLVDQRRRYRKREMTHAQVGDTRREITAALAHPLKPQVRSRLIAMDNVLSGQSIDDAAAGALVRPDTVRDWLRVVTYDGIAPTLARWEGRGNPRPRQVDADPVALRELVAKEKNPRVRKRMLALACVAEGMSPHAASMSMGLNHQAIAARMRRFREEGVAAFRDRKIGGRPHKLSAAQFQELRIEFLGRPGMQPQQLRDLIWTRFRVRYSLSSLRRLLKKELGIVLEVSRRTRFKEV